MSKEVWHTIFSMSTFFDCATLSAVCLSDWGIKTAVDAMDLKNPQPADIAAIQTILQKLVEQINAYANGGDLEHKNLCGIFQFLAKCVVNYMDADDLAYTPPLTLCRDGKFRQLLDCDTLNRQLAFSLNEFMYGFVFSGFETMGTLNTVGGFPEPDFVEWTAWILELLEQIKPIAEW